MRAISRLYRSRFLQPKWNTHFSDFFSIFRDLQYYHSFAPLQTKKFSKNSSTFFQDFSDFCEFFHNFHQILHRCWWIFFGISLNLVDNVKNSSNFQISDEFRQNSDGILLISHRICQLSDPVKYEWNRRPAARIFPKRCQSGCIKVNRDDDT